MDYTQNSKNRNRFITEVKKSDLPSKSKLLAAALVTYVNNKTGLCCPSHKALRDDFGIHPRWIAAAVKELTESGLASCYRPKNRETYYILMPTESQIASCQRAIQPCDRELNSSPNSLMYSLSKTLNRKESEEETTEDTYADSTLTNSCLCSKCSGNTNSIKECEYE